MADMYLSLATALESSYKADSVLPCEPCGHCSPGSETSKPNAECDLHSGLAIEVTEQPHTMHQVVNLIMVLNRMKRTQKDQSTEFTDDQLSNVLFENLVEEYVIPEVHPQTHQSADHFEQSDQPAQKCFICDDLSKFLVLRKGITTELQAITLQAGNMSSRVELELSTYKPSVTRDQGRPVALGVGGNLYLCCTSSSGKPVLSLEMVTKEDLKNISGDMRRFLFFKTVSGQTLTSFESAKYEGYFISTSNAEGQRVDMCQSQDAPDRRTMFKVL